MQFDNKKQIERNQQDENKNQPQILEWPASRVTCASARDGQPARVRASGSPRQPFHADFITQFETVLEFPILHVTVNGQGQATHMGKTRAFTDDQIANLLDGSGSATYTLTAANGDTLILALVVQPGGNINVAGGVIFSGDYTVTGGTGRFSGATGGGVFAGAALFLDETDGIGCFAVVGTISK